MSRLTRRAFLQNSAFATTAAALAAQPLFHHSELLAADDEVLRVAVVGFNGRGGAHISGFGNRKDCVIAALVDVDEAVANRKADDLEKSKGKRPTIYADIRKMLEDDSIDWCIKEAREQGDENAVALGQLLRAMTLKQRLQCEFSVCPCGCTNELRAELGLPVHEPSVVVESLPGGVTIRPAVEPAEPPDGGWKLLVPEPGAIKGWRKP